MRELVAACCWLLANCKSSRNVVMSVILVRQGPLGFLQQTITGSPTIAPVAIVGHLITYCPVLLTVQEGQRLPARNDHLGTFTSPALAGPPTITGPSCHKCHFCRDEHVFVATKYVF